MLKLSFVSGTLELRNVPAGNANWIPADCQWDPRTACYRAPGSAYASIRRALHQTGHSVDDVARKYDELAHGLAVQRAPRLFQSEALQAWEQHQGRGVVVLPTGAGKTDVALLAIDSKRRNTLVIAPTLDLVHQWYEQLRERFRRDVGVIGGGDYRVAPLTVSTYDSAYMHMEHLGNRFGLVVFDECHHLPGDAYALAARSCIAPYRLGLTATPERADGRHVALQTLIGSTVYQKNINELAGAYLADYTVEKILVSLTDDERRHYKEARETYRGFVRQQGIDMRRPDGWSQFIIRSSISAEGREAMVAYQKQKQLAFAAPSKLTYVQQLLHKHRHDRALLFTERNRTALAMSRRFLVPVITHQTKVTERSAILQDFAAGHYNALATSKVLNEGVDIPAANVGIVVSGSGSTREHVQRLGRILRQSKNKGKKAVLYELVAEDTSEMFTSERRRDHVAYH